MRNILILLTLVLLSVGVFANDGSEEIATNWALKVLDWGTSIIGTASIIASFTPTKKDNAFVSILSAILNALAFNFGKAKNK